MTGEPGGIQSDVKLSENFNDDPFAPKPLEGPEAFRAAAAPHPPIDLPARDMAAALGGLSALRANPVARMGNATLTAGLKGLDLEIRNPGPIPGVMAPTQTFKQ